MIKNSEALEISFPLQRGPCFRTVGADPRVEGSGRLPRVTQVLALAIHFENMIEHGDAKDYADLGRLGGLCRERVSRIMRLIYLAPDIQVELLYLAPAPTGRYPISETAVRKIANLLSWVEQRDQWAQLKQAHRLS